MASKKQIMDKLSALNPSMPTKTRFAPEAVSPPVPETRKTPETNQSPINITPQIETTPSTPSVAPLKVPLTVIEAKQVQIAETAVIAPPVIDDSGICTFKLFVDNMAVMMKISEEIQRNFLNINTMMVDSYQKTLTITFDAMLHNYDKFVDGVKRLFPSIIQD